MFEVDLDPGLILPLAEQRPDGRLYLRCQPDGCPHLSEARENRCQVYSQRPSACRNFPFMAVDTPGGRFIGASFACTAVAQGIGPRLQAQDRDWQGLSSQQMQVYLMEDLVCSWDVYLRLEEYLADQLCYSDGLFSSALSISQALSRGNLSGSGFRGLTWLSEQVEATCQRTLRGLLAMTEANGQPERAQEVLLALAQGSRYFSEIFCAWVEPRQVQAALEQEEPEHWLEVEAFFRHLLFRKFLWGAPSVHARVCLLPLINEMIRYWTWQQALSQRGRVEAEMRRLAIREVERRLTFHARGWEDFLIPLSQTFLQGVR